MGLMLMYLRAAVVAPVQRIVVTVLMSLVFFALSGNCAQDFTLTVGAPPWLQISSLNAGQRTRIKEAWGRVASQQESLFRASSPTFGPGQKLPRTAFERYQALSGLQLTETLVTGEILSLLTIDQREEAARLWTNYHQTLKLDFLKAHQKQQKSMAFCWAACFQAILEAAGVQMSQNELAEKITPGAVGTGATITNLLHGAGSVPKFRDVIANRQVECFLYPVDYGDMTVVRIFRQPRFIVLPLGSQHAVLVTGIEWTGLGTDSEIYSITVYDPMDGSERDYSKTEWQAIRKKLPGILNIGVGPIFFTYPSHHVGDPGYLVTDEVFLIKRNDKMVFVNEQGMNVLDKEFDRIEAFSFGMMAKVGNTWYYLEKSGAQHKLGSFDDLRGYGFGGSHHINLAPAKLGDKWGFIDTSGQIVIPARWNDVGGFSQGRCAVVDERGQWGYIDDAGATVIAMHYDQTTPFFFTGLQHPTSAAFVRIGADWRMIDESGVPVSDEKFEDIGAVMFKSFVAKKEGKWGYFAFSGGWIVPPRFESAGPFVAGLAPVKEPGEAKQFGYIDEFGVYEIRPRFQQAMPFLGYDRAIVETDRGWGMIDRSGVLILRPQYALLTPGSNRYLLATDWRGQGWYIDDAGRKIINAGVSDILGKIRGPEFVALTFQGSFQGCDAYFIPLADWEDFGPELVKNRSTALLSTGIPANGVVQVLNQTYMVLIEKSGRLQTNKIAVFTTTKPVINVRLQ